MGAQEGGQQVSWPLLLGGVAIGAAAGAAAYSAALYIHRSQNADTRSASRRRSRRSRRHRSVASSSGESADDEADESTDEVTSATAPRSSRPARHLNGLANGNGRSRGSGGADTPLDGRAAPGAWDRQRSDTPKAQHVRLSQGGEAARQGTSAAAPRYQYPGPSNGGVSGPHATDSALPDAALPLRWEVERHTSAALPGAAPGAAPAHLVPGTLTSNPGHAPAPTHHLSTANDLITEGRMQEDAALHEQYTRVITPEPALNEETEDVCALLKECYDLRDKWLFRSSVVHSADAEEVANPSDLLERDPFEFDPTDPQTQPLDFDFEMVHGVTRVWTDSSRATLLADTPGSSYEFFVDMHRMLTIQAMGTVRSFCFHRLLLLEQKFNLHVMMNADREFLAQKSAPHRDFYNVRKVDTHIHHSACMHQKHLLRFIKSKLRKEPDQVVIFRDGKYLTLAEVFESLQMTGHDLNVDTLDMHADKNIFHRFDKFNLKYNPCGQSRLREIFIKQDNIIHGRFLAELTREVVSDLEASKYQHAELRVSIYGRKRVEWDILAAWICQARLYSDNVVWLIQIPRLYAVYKEQGIIETFEQMLDNIFTPLFEVTRDPTAHPQLHLFLKQVVGFDMVDDESKPERRPNKHMQQPDAWDLKYNPAYSYYAFYTYANLYTLNKMREARGLNTFSFRPHAGEAGDVDHLASAFMLCENIAHGINLRKSPCLQYMYYLKQIGLCMSPLSNNSLFLDYHRNPLPTFFARGLNVSLSTDDPLQIHLTKEPLVEEYSVAAQVWKLSATDLCEIARSSVLHSGFPHQVKMHWVHREYWKMGPEGNDIQKTNVPNLRMRFRADTFMEELSTVMSGAAAHALRQGAKSS